MKIALIGVLIGLVLMGVAWLGLQLNAKQIGRYKAKRTLLTEPEQVLFHRLRQAFPDWHVFAQVSLNQLVAVAPTVSDKRTRASLFNRINGKALDFVVCGADTSPLLIVELDDSSHNRKDRRKADQQKDEALESAELRFVRVNVKKLPSTTELAAMLQANDAPNEQEHHDE